MKHIEYVSRSTGFNKIFKYLNNGKSISCDLTFNPVNMPLNILENKIIQTFSYLILK